MASNRVTILSASQPAAQNGRPQINDVLCRELRGYKTNEIAIFYAEHDRNSHGYVAELATYLERETLGTGTRSDPRGLVHRLPAASLAWCRPQGYLRDLTKFDIEVAAAVPEPSIRCFVVLTDLAGFNAATGRNPLYLGLCQADVAGLRSGRPRITKLHSKFDVDVARIPNLIPA